MVNLKSFTRVPWSWAEKGESMAICRASWKSTLAVALCASFAKGDSKREESRMRRTSLRPNYLGSLTHFSPYANCSSIHIEEPNLLASLAADSVDTDCSQET